MRIVSYARANNKGWSVPRCLRVGVSFPHVRRVGGLEQGLEGGKTKSKRTYAYKESREFSRSQPHVRFLGCENGVWGMLQPLTLYNP